MKKFFYDLHIHTALSPCADIDMTPTNIVLMSKLKSLDVIAITDHNSVGNALSVMDASRRENGPLVIVGMELTTSEDIHILLLFYSIENAIECGKEVSLKQFKIENKEEVFGEQLYLDEYDNTINKEKFLLIPSTSISVENVADLAAKYNAVAIPAHVDKPSNGIIGILGLVPPELHFHTIEISPLCREEYIVLNKLNEYLLLHNSDSHYLGTLNEKNNNFLELNSLTVSSVLDKIKLGQKYYKK